MRLFVLLCLLIMGNFATVHANVQQAKPVSFESIEKEISQKKNEIESLTKKISNLENGLSSKNKKIIELMNKKQKLETFVYELQDKLKVLRKNLDDKNKQLTANLGKILATQIDAEKSYVDLALRKVLIQDLRLKIAHQTSLVNEINQFDDKLKLAQNKLNEYFQAESELISLVKELEDEKQDLAQAYVNEMSKRDELEKRQVKLKTSMANTQQRTQSTLSSVGESLKVDAGFIMPLDNHVGFSHNGKGVTYKYKGRASVYAPKKGKIIYNGRLSTYGNVIMIDHGTDTRTVLLGNLNSAVKKDDQVEQGDMIGSVQDDGEGTLYFEVRKMNKVQNTLPLIDKQRSLAQNNVKSTNI